MTRFKLNSQLARQLREHPDGSSSPAPALYPKPLGKRIYDRLNNNGIAKLIAAFKLGVPKHVDAEHYGISETRVTRLLWKHAVRGQRQGKQR